MLDPHMDHALADVDRLGHRGDEPIGQARRLLGVVDIDTEHGELVTTEAGHEVARRARRRACGR